MNLILFNFFFFFKDQNYLQLKKKINGINYQKLKSNNSVEAMKEYLILNAFNIKKIIIQNNFLFKKKNH